MGKTCMRMVYILIEKEKEREKGRERGSGREWERRAGENGKGEMRERMGKERKRERA